jgi:isopentenyl-diphosphate delta-isomerase
MENDIILVDIFDNEISTGEKLSVHQEKKLHRAFSVFIIDDGKMLLQKRAYNKYHSGGLWANACCSHPRVGETFEVAVERRLQEELNINCRFKELFSFVYFQEYQELCEYEYDHVFLADYKGEVIYNEAEIAEIKWITFENLKAELQTHQENYAAWFIIAAPKVLKQLTMNSK